MNVFSSEKRTQSLSLSVQLRCWCHHSKRTLWWTAVNGAQATGHRKCSHPYCKHLSIVFWDIHFPVEPRKEISTWPAVVHRSLFCGIIHLFYPAFVLRIRPPSLHMIYITVHWHSLQSQKNTLSDVEFPRNNCYFSTLFEFSSSKTTCNTI